MRKRSITCAAMDATDADGISTSQTPASGPNEAMTITGTLATAGVATLANATNITVTSASDDVGSILTITGTDADGTICTETLTLTSGPGVDSGVIFFKTITGITIDLDTVGALTVGVLSTNDAVSPTMEVQVGQDGTDWTETLFTDIGAGTYTVEMTVDGKNDTYTNGWSNDANWVAITAFSAKTADVASLLTISCFGLRVKNTSWTSGEYVATLIERGPVV